MDRPAAMLSQVASWSPALLTITRPSASLNSPAAMAARVTSGSQCAGGADDSIEGSVRTGSVPGAVSARASSDRSRPSRAPRRLSRRRLSRRAMARTQERNGASPLNVA